MNLNLIRWLLAHRDLLTQILDAVRGYNKNLPPLEQWAIVDKVARLVIPVLSSSEVADLQAFSWENDDTMTALTLGAEYAAMGVDWQTLLKVIIPILEIILRALTPDE